MTYRTTIYSYGAPRFNLSHPRLLQLCTTIPNPRRLDLVFYPFFLHSGIIDKKRKDRGR